MYGVNVTARKLNPSGNPSPNDIFCLDHLINEKALGRGAQNKGYQGRKHGKGQGGIEKNVDPGGVKAHDMEVSQKEENWTDGVEVEVLSSSIGYIDVVVDQAWRCTRFYGNPNMSLRVNSLRALSTLKAVSCLPWVVGGDFNEVLRRSEKKEEI
ncbi:hypothetical protein ACFE04_021407 [Oxalis oulophora]